MKKMLLVMRYEIAATLHRKTFVIIAFAVPLVAGIVAMVVILSGRGGQVGPVTTVGVEEQPAVEGPVREGYVDPGGLIRTLPPNLTAGRLAAYPSEPAAQAALRAGEISGYYLIPVDYASSGQLVYALADYNPLEDRAPTGAIEAVLLFNLLGGDEVLLEQARDPLVLKATSLAPVQSEGGGGDRFAELLSTMMVLILYLVVLIPASGVAAALTDERKNRVMEVLATSASPRQIFFGKIVALGLLGLLQVVLWMGILAAVATFGRGQLGVPPGFALPSGLIAWALVYFLGGYAIYGSLMAGLGALAPDVKDTRGPTLVIMSPMILAYLLNIIIVDEPNGPVALIASLFPLTSPVSMMARITTTTVPFWQTAVAAGLQFVTAALIIRMVARLFRAQTLLSGQAFRMDTFLRALLTG